jgi:hypothetical protein
MGRSWLRASNTGIFKKKRGKSRLTQGEGDYSLLDASIGRMGRMGRIGLMGWMERRLFVFWIAQFRCVLIAQLRNGAGLGQAPCPNFI